MRVYYDTSTEEPITILTSKIKTKPQKLYLFYNTENTFYALTVTLTILNVFNVK